MATGLVSLLDDFDDAVRARVDQNRSTIDDGIAIVANAVFLRNVVVSYSIARQVGADPHIALVGVRRMMPLDDVAVKPGTLVDTEHTIDAADDATNGPADNSSDRAGGTFAFAGAAFNASRDALGGSDGGKQK